MTSTLVTPCTILIHQISTNVHQTNIHQTFQGGEDGFHLVHLVHHIKGH